MSLFKRAPKWTREIPTKVGWYFWRNVEESIPAQPVLVDEWIRRTADGGGEYWPVKIETPPGTPEPWTEPK